MAAQKAKVKTIPWDPAEHIEDDAYAALYLDGALEDGFEDGDFRVVARVIWDIVRWKGMTAVASSTGLDAEVLRKAFSDAGNPDLLTVLQVARALGLRLRVEVDTDGPANKS